MRKIRAVAVLPTLFTLGNLVCGFFAIVVASRIERADSLDWSPSPKIESLRALRDSLDPTHNLMLCGGLIFLAMLFDTFDGHVARLTRCTSDFGGQLDSLCDAVSFGVAPAILLVKMCPQFTELHRETVWCVAALFACCAALRLARFNVENDEEDEHTWFQGLPSPAAAAVIASSAMFSYTLRSELNYEFYADYDWWLQRLLPLAGIALALLMVSRVAYPHIVTQLLRGNKSFPQLVTIFCTLMAIVAVRWYAIPVLCMLYAMVPAFFAGRRYVRRRLRKSKHIDSDPPTESSHDVYRIG